MRRIRFRDHAIESAACLWAIETAVMLLEREADEKPVRMLVSSEDEDAGDQIRHEIARAKQLIAIIERLEVIVHPEMPPDAWCVQGENAEIYSEGP